VEGIVLSAIFRVFTIYNLWTGAYGRSVFLVRVMDFFQRGISAMMAFLGLGLGVSIFVLAGSALAHFVPLDICGRSEQILTP
jgi:hypothetical protein